MLRFLQIIVFFLLSFSTKCNALTDNELHAANNFVKAIPEGIFTNTKEEILENLKSKKLVLFQIYGTNWNEKNREEVLLAIQGLSFLESIALINVQFKNYPKAFTRLEHLTLLSLTRCRFESPIKSFGKLPSLHSLVLINNGFTSLPEDMNRLNIEYIELHDENLSTLPESIWELTHLKKAVIALPKLTNLSPNISHLKQLEDLELRSNALSFLPATLAQAPNLISVNAIYCPQLSAEGDGENWGIKELKDHFKDKFSAPIVPRQMTPAEIQAMQERMNLGNFVFPPQAHTKSNDDQE